MTRLPAEWEPQSFVQYTFPHANSDWESMLNEVYQCFVEIIESTACFEPVVVCCQDIAAVKQYFKIPTAYPIHFVTIDSNDSWTRDHGGITVVDENNRATVLDFTFNGWGNKYEAEKDNLITSKLFDIISPQTPLQSHNFVLEGGSIESDGKGTVMVTSRCLLSSERNPELDREQIDAYLCSVLGVEQVLWLDHGHLLGDDTDGHIDTLARFADEQTIVYTKCTDKNDEHFESLSAMEAQLATFSNSDGIAYSLVSLPLPSPCFDDNGDRLPATYANFLIVNGGLLVPLYGVKEDEEALAILKKVFPDREVRGIDCRALIQQHGSLHCVSMQYPSQLKIDF